MIKVHFRARTYKGDIESESNGGCRWNHFFIEQLIQFKCGDQEILEEKYQVAAERSYAYSFMMGATNEIWKSSKNKSKNVAGIKIFFGIQQEYDLIMKLL
jgi:hypothetical protein